MVKYFNIIVFGSLIATPIIMKLLNKTESNYIIEILVYLVVAGIIAAITYALNKDFRDKLHKIKKHD